MKREFIGPFIAGALVIAGLKAPQPLPHAPDTQPQPPTPITTALERTPRSPKIETGKFSRDFVVVKNEFRYIRNRTITLSKTEEPRAVISDDGLEIERIDVPVFP